MGEIPCPLPRCPPSFPAHPGSSVPNSDSLSSALYCRQQETRQTRSAGPQSQPPPTPFYGTPLCNADSGRLNIDHVSLPVAPLANQIDRTARLSGLVASQAATVNILFAAVFQAHRPTGQTQFIRHAHRDESIMLS